MVDCRTLDAIRLIFSTPSVSQEAKEKVAHEYRELRHGLRRLPDFAEINRQIEEVFKEHGV